MGESTVRFCAQSEDARRASQARIGQRARETHAVGSLTVRAARVRRVGVRGAAAAEARGSSPCLLACAARRCSDERMVSCARCLHTCSPLLFLHRWSDGGYGNEVGKRSRKRSRTQLKLERRGRPAVAPIRSAPA
eukprot:7377932-Prymnesium_polylepis.2